MTPLETSLLAHSGGWDDFALFAIPAALAIFGLRWAERRARRAHEAEQRDAAGASTDGSDTTS